MNIRIYYNANFIELKSKRTQSAHNQDIVKSNEINNEIKTIVKNLLLKNENTFNDLDLSYFIDFFKKEHKFIKAAGGLIKKNNHYLFIKRLGKWDLPKGKLEKNETEQTGAIRECEEECGINNLHIIKQIPSTFHIYEHKQKLILKESIWFLMETDFNENLTPQLEENITEVKWFTIDEIKKNVLLNTYPTISDLLHNTIS
ncbi:MAG: NUDIX domain-containing protein [Bacteroidetes bacterium]|nr:NUDIX domain-containing protein [Bacteroidota bacterium]